MTTQENCVETKKGMNSMNEENDVSNRHMTWWRNAWWVRMDTPTDGARPSKSVASSHESRAGNARDRKGRRGRKGGMGDGKQRKQRKRLARRIPLSQHHSAPTTAAAAAASVVATTRLQ